MTPTTAAKPALPPKAGVFLRLAAWGFGLGVTGFSFLSALRNIFSDHDWPKETDIGLYVTAADAIGRGVSPFSRALYPWDPYAYPPLLAEFVLLLKSALGIAGLGVVWPLLSLACLIGALALMLRGFGAKIDWAWVALVVGVLMLSRTVRSDLYHGQINFMLLLLLVGGLKLQLAGRDLMAAAVWAVMIVCKPFLGVMVFYLAWRGQWRAAIATLGASALVFGLSFLPMLPHVVEAVRGWMDISHFYTSWHYAATPRNQSFYGLFIRMFSETQFATPWLVQPALVMPLLVPVAVAAVALFVIATPRGVAERTETRALLEVGLVYALSFAVGPLTEGDHLFMVLPGLVGAGLMLLAHWRDETRRLWLAAVVLWLLTFAQILSPVRLPITFITPDEWRVLHGPGLLLSVYNGAFLLAASAATVLALRRVSRQLSA